MYMYMYIYIHIYIFIPNCTRNHDITSTKRVEFFRIPWQHRQGKKSSKYYVVFLSRRRKTSISLLWLMPDDFTLQRESSSGVRVNQAHFEKLRPKAYLHDTIVVYDSSLWRMRLRHKSTVPAWYGLGNVANGPEDSYNCIGYVKMNNCARQSYRVNEPRVMLKSFNRCVCNPGFTYHHMSN